MSDEISYHILEPANAQLLAGADVFDHPVDPAQLAAFVADAGHELVFAMGQWMNNNSLICSKPPAR